MKKIITLLAVIGISLAAIAPANAWYRGGYGGYGWRGPVYNNYYYGGYGRGYGGWGNYGAAIGIGAGAALLGGVIGGAIAAQQPYYGGGYYYGGYYCGRGPVYDAWGNFIGYAGC